MSVQFSTATPTFPAIKSVFISGNNASAAISLTAVSGQRHHVVGIIWSYSAAPTNGRITSIGLDGDQLDFDITQGGPGPVLTPPAIGATNTTVSITLAAGGSGITGKLTVFYVTQP